MSAFDKLSDEQKAAASALQRVIAAANTELERAAAAGLNIDVGTIDVTTVGSRARVIRITATATEEPFHIA